jgi:hypothetical protein
MGVNIRMDAKQGQHERALMNGPVVFRRRCIPLHVLDSSSQFVFNSHQPQTLAHQTWLALGENRPGLRCAARRRGMPGLPFPSLYTSSGRKSREVQPLPT